MSKQTVPSVPLITCDPYFSVWSPCNALTDGPTESWAGAQKPIDGTVEIDGAAYRFLGAGSAAPMEQLSLEITATASIYRFAAAGVELEIRFTSPLLLSDLDLVSRPCTYIDFTASSADGKPHCVVVRLAFDEAHCYDGDGRPDMACDRHEMGTYSTVWMGKEKQSPLNHSGDSITIDWGYLYLALPTGQNGQVSWGNGERHTLCAELRFEEVTAPQTAYAVAAYDDVLSIMYFGEARKAYWARNGKTILEAIGESVAEHDTLLTRCAVFDESLRELATAKAGEPYARICALAYRQSIAGHKLITDGDGEVIFLSKECHSNGCIGTSDITYPSAPLYLLYAPELVRGMLRPIFTFARMPVWEYDFAPHDVGRYPYVSGQVYGARFGRVDAQGNQHLPGGAVPSPYYQYPAGSDVYAHNLQMPVEECGNMIIMTAAACVAGDDFRFGEENLDLLQKWVCYLIRYGSDPENQLCTDDFAGHLAHNINLSAKAVMGIAAYALILDGIGRHGEAEQYFEKARTMAKSWEKRASRGNHTGLTFDKAEGWSLKYNLVWDQLFQSELFSPELIQSEVAHYLTLQNRYGVPLDSRKDYTKSDWILWVAAMADKDSMAKLIAPIATFLEETGDRVPFSDWYDTKTGEHYHFQNRTVQGGLFMPLLRDQWSD